MKKFTSEETGKIKDISFVQHKILAFEIKHGIEDIPDFRTFLKKRTIIETPESALQNSTPQTLVEETKYDIEPTIIKGLPIIKGHATSGINDYRSAPILKYIPNV